ncbi:MAG: phosphonate ABC transporter, permease protein PhnE [Alphaproteobacteria bacterium]|jgi:phosphonate transport system permease protein
MAASPLPAAATIPPPPQTPLGQRLINTLLLAVAALLLAGSIKAVDLGNIGRVVTNSGNMRQLGVAFIHPDFILWKVYVAQMWLTIQIALWGTVLAILIAVPFGLLCAKNITPMWIQQPMRRLMDIQRSIPDLVVGMVFITAVGLGPLAGVIAIMVNTGAVLAKLFSEAVESIDTGPVEGVRATGAAPLQEIVWGVIPQVAPLWTSYSLYRFESNSRSATVLGLIGAGGIGQVLYDSLNAFNYRQTTAIVVVIVVAVSLIDLLSQAIRSRLL